MTNRVVAPALLKAARQERNITLRRLAANVGISAGYLSDLEAGVKGGSADTHARLAEALGVAVEDITYDQRTHRRCPTCGGRGVIPLGHHGPSGAAA